MCADSNSDSNRTSAKVNISVVESQGKVELIKLIIYSMIYNRIASKIVPKIQLITLYFAQTFQIGCSVMSNVILFLKFLFN